VTRNELKERFGRTIEAPLMDYLTDLGERHEIDWLIYNPLRMRMFHRYARRDAAGVMAAIDQVLPRRRRYADVGAGSGAFAAEAARRGHEVTAYERSRVGRWIARRQGVDCRRFDLRSIPPGGDGYRADLAYSFEVAEHLGAELGDRLVEFLTLAAPIVVFTAAQPGQGGSGHVNEQPRDYWAQRFAAREFVEAAELSSRLSAEFVQRGVQGTWFARNVAVYCSSRRASPPVMPAGHC
jgi:SAM-dependent methyltransferase